MDKQPGQDVRAMAAATWDDAAIGSLVATFAHASNNRLTVILSCLDLLATSDVADPDLRAAVDLAQGASHQLATELAALLGAARGRAGDVLAVDVGDALIAARDLQSAARPDAVPVEMEIAAGFTVESNPSRFVAALARAFEVARRRKATRVQVRTEAVEVAGRVTGQPALRKGRYVRVEFLLQGATPFTAGSDEAAASGHVSDRLRDADGLELASLEAFAAALRGRCVASGGVDDPRLHLYLPAVAMPGGTAPCA